MKVLFPLHKGPLQQLSVFIQGHNPTSIPVSGVDKGMANECMGEPSRRTVVHDMS